MTPLEYAQQAAAAAEQTHLFIDPAVAAEVPQATRQTLEAELAAQPADGLPVYVVLTDGQHSSGDMPTLVHSALDIPASVVLVLSPYEGIVHEKITVPFGTETDAYQRVASAKQEAIDEPPLNQAVRIVETLGDEDFVAPADNGTTTGHDWQPGPLELFTPGAGSAAALVLIPVLILAVGAVLLARRRRTRRPAAGYRLPEKLLTHARALQTTQLRRDLTEDSLRIAERLSAFDTTQLSAAQAETVEHGLDAYRMAGAIVDAQDAGAADLAGALVLLSIAAADLDAVQRSQAIAGRAAGRAADGQPRQAGASALCTIDPTHGQAATRIREAAVSAGVDVPVCRSCAADIAAGRSPDWLYDGAVPYIETDSIWARTLFGTIGDDLVTQLRREGTGAHPGTHTSGTED